MNDPAEVRPDPGRWRARPRVTRAAHLGLGRARPRHGRPGPHSWYGGKMMRCNAQHAGPGFGHGWHGRRGSRHARQEARRDGDRDRHPRQSARCLARFHRRAAGHGEAAIRTQRLDFSQRRQGAVRACATSRRQRDRPRQERPRFVEGGRCPAHQAHAQSSSPRWPSSRRGSARIAPWAATRFRPPSPDHGAKPDATSPTIPTVLPLRRRSEATRGGAGKTPPLLYAALIGTAFLNSASPHA